MRKNRIKKIATVLVACVLIFSAVTSSAAVTYQRSGKNVHYSGASYKVYYNEKRVNNAKTPALMINKNILMPYYRTLVKRGPKVTSKRSGRKLTLTYKSNKVVLTLNKRYMYVNNKKIRIRTAPVLAKLSGKSTYMIPARAVCSALGLSYTYNAAKKAVYITNASGTTKSAGDTSLQATTFKRMTTSQFINTLGPLAQANYEKTGVLASVTLAQAINESGWGKSNIAQKANNLFGMKTSLSGNTWSGSVWDGKSYITVNTVEEYNGKKVTETAKFRKYSSVLSSIEDHSAYLVNAKNGLRKRYAGITSTTSYAEQLSILQKGGYCTWSGYVSELTALIKTYNLTKWDK